MQRRGDPFVEKTAFLVDANISRPNTVPWYGTNAFILANLILLIKPANKFPEWQILRLEEDLQKLQRKKDLFLCMSVARFLHVMKLVAHTV